MYKNKLKLPIGFDLFGKIIPNDYYYVDKTKFIKDFLSDAGEVALFTRPRRFGKTLNMSMFAEFFDIQKDSKDLFSHLYISKEEALCNEWMNQYPVIFITLKDIGGLNFTSAYKRLKVMIATLYRQHLYLLEGKGVSDHDKEDFNTLASAIRENASDELVSNSLALLIRMMQEHFNKQVILLIDEYDVPLAKANDEDYYLEMVDIVKSLLSPVLKSNPSLKLAMLTGCLRISKESIFTGLNNLGVYTISDTRFSEYFGFTKEEVVTLLQYYELTDYHDLIKEWYNGYQFGNQEIYCPWDVISYVKAVRSDPDLLPSPYWINTSGNSIVKRLLEKAESITKREIEQLIEGKAISKNIKQELTYSELEDNIDNIWSVLYATGYLTATQKPNGNPMNLMIPNKEVLEIYILQVNEWFKDKVVLGNPIQLRAFCDAFQNGESEKIQTMFQEYLKKSISIRDTVTKSPKENFYHGILMGLLRYQSEWYIHSNMETGDGYCDILVEMEDNCGCIIEVKYGERKKLESLCHEALKQIENTNYVEQLEDDGMTTIYRYGIACYKKECRVIQG